MLYVTPETLAFLREYHVQAIKRERLRQRMAEKQRRVPAKAFATVVERIGRILNEGNPTKFQHEGACRSGLRVHLIGKGWGWAEADQEALRILAAALKAIGAERPSWMQGQPEYRERSEYDWRFRHCMACGGVLDDDHPGRHCSKDCAGVTAKRTWARDNRERMAALTKSWAAANPERRKAIVRRNIERADPRDCQHCGTTYQVANGRKTAFCSPACGYAARSAAAAKRKEKQCAYCLGTFIARSRTERGVTLNQYCSRTCSSAAKRRDATTIFKCDEVE